ncbi:hypothetical protein V501_09757 [Pseudogymnoascus sp. VKM F-4519 (FW-2642)]|nr:hypothetical protein V501_09757 [Pseudogymnoascus sp. VKM F-4519 (FW-2642)]
MSNRSRGGRGAGGRGDIDAGSARGDSQRGRGGRGRGFRNRGEGGRGGGSGGGGSYFQASPPAEVFGGGRFPRLDPDVTQLEDDFIRQQSAVGASVAKLSVNEDFPTRPAYGTRGTPITLWANYFTLQPAKNLLLYRYHVSILPEAKGRKLKRIFDLLIQEPALAYGATDFKTFLILRDKVEEIEFEIAYRSEFEDDPQPNTRPYRVKI